MGGAVSSVVDKVGDIGQGAINTVSDVGSAVTAPLGGWTNVRDTLEAGGVAAGNYLLPGSGLLTSQLVSEGAKDALSSDLGQAAMIGGGIAGGINGNMSNYGKVGDLITGTPTPTTEFTGTLPVGSEYVAPQVTELGTVASTDPSAALASPTQIYEAGTGGTNLFADAAIPGNAADLSGYGATGTNFLTGAIDWATASPQNALTAAGLGLTAAKAIGGSTPSSSTSTTAIDPEMKAAYLRNLEEARTTAAGLGTKQFAAFPTYNNEVVNQYMNPYQQQVIDTTLSDIERQRQQAQLRDRAAAVQAKAFGGSRQGVAEALTNEAYQRTAANTVANLRSQGFTNAQAIALQQEEAKRQYEQQKLDAVRNLGLERLNISQSALGLQPANLGGTQTTPIYSNPTASALGGALSGGMLGNMIGGATGAGYGAAAGGLLGLLK